MVERKRLHLQRARELLNMSQGDVARLLGTTVRSISRWELGERTPSAYFRSQLCELYQQRADELDLGHTAGERGDALYDPNIPLPTSLVGREQDIKHVKQQLLHGQDVALHGLPGVGKTTLVAAMTYEQDIRNHFSDGILWAGLGPTPHTTSILTHWKKLLSLSSDEAEGHESKRLAHILRQKIGESCYLLILDDVWTLEEAFALKVGGPNCVHLLTTRFPTIATQFAATTSMMVQELTESDGVTLLQRLAPFVMEHEPQRMVGLVQAVGGLPLAISLMGNYLRVQSHSKQLRRGRNALDRLAQDTQRLHLEAVQIPTEMHTSLPFETTLSLSSVLSVTVQRLTERSRTTLSALSLLPAKPQHFSESTALYLADCTTWELDELTDAGLLLTSGENYMLHPVVADYAREYLRDPHVRARFQIVKQKGVF